MNAAQPRAPKLVAFPLAVWERDGLKAALRNAKLPSDDVDTDGCLFWRFTTINDTPAGFGGLEIHGGDALLRSVVTLPPLRGRGVGSSIVAALEAEAAVRHCRTVYLLTTSDTDYFARLGYAPCARVKVPAAIQKTQQYASLCPDDAEVMVKRL